MGVRDFPPGPGSAQPQPLSVHGTLLLAFENGQTTCRAHASRENHAAPTGWAAREHTNHTSQSAFPLALNHCSSCMELLPGTLLRLKPVRKPGSLLVFLSPVHLECETPGTPEEPRPSASHLPLGTFGAEMCTGPASNTRPIICNGKVCEHLLRAGNKLLSDNVQS